MLTSLLTPRTALGNAVLALALVGTPYIAFLASLLLSELVMLIPFFSRDDHLQWIVDLAFFLTPLLFLPVGFCYIMAALAVEDHIMRSARRFLLYGLTLPACLAVSWYGAGYLSAYVENIFSFDFSWTEYLFFTLNILSLPFLVITLNEYWFFHLEPSD